MRHPTPGVLLASGKDRLDLIHRMSANAVADLQPRQSRPTVLTNALGRIVDLVTVVHGEPRSLLITSPEQAGRVFEWLQGFIFFNDEVQLEPQHEPLTFWGVYGPKASEEVARLIEPGEPLQLEAAAGFKAVWRAEGPLSGWQLLLGGALSQTADEIWSAGAQAEAVHEAYSALRIEAGLPLFGQDFSPEMSPLEAGLEFAVSSTKGCYIGQEVIARMQSRDRVPRRLWGVKLGGAAELGADLTANGRSVGTLTSSARSPKFGWIGLAQVESRGFPADGRVAVADRSIDGMLVPLPFGAGRTNEQRSGSQRSSNSSE